MKEHRPTRLGKLSSEGLSAWDLFVAEIRNAGDFEVDSTEWAEALAGAFKRARDSGKMASLQTIRALEADISRFDARHIQSERRKKLDKEKIRVLQRENQRLRDERKKAGGL